MAFGLTEVGIGVNAKKIQAYVEEHAGRQLSAVRRGRGQQALDHERRARRAHRHRRALGKDGPEHRLVRRRAAGRGRARAAPVATTSFAASRRASRRSSRTSIRGCTFATSRCRRRTASRPTASRCCSIACAWGAACSRRWRPAISACSRATRATTRCSALGVGGPVIRHEVPRLNLGADSRRRVAGARARVPVVAAGRRRRRSRRTPRSHEVGGRGRGRRIDARRASTCSAAAAFHGGSRVNDARVNLHLFGVVEGEDDLILMGMVRDVTQRFVERYLGRAARRDPVGQRGAGRQQACRRSSASCASASRTLLRHPGRSVAAVAAAARAAEVLAARRLGARATPPLDLAAAAAAAVAGRVRSRAIARCRRRCAATRASPSASCGCCAGAISA